MDNMEVEFDRQACLDSVREVQKCAEDVVMRMERIPIRFKDILANVALYRWEQRVFKRHDKVHKVKLLVSSLRYDCAGLVESLMRLLFKLDAIESHGDAEIRASRKDTIVHIQEKIVMLEREKKRIERLMKNIENWFPTPPPSEISSTAVTPETMSEASPMKEEEIEQEGDTEENGDIERHDAIEASSSHEVEKQEDRDREVDESLDDDKDDDVHSPSPPASSQEQGDSEETNPHQGEQDATHEKRKRAQPSAAPEISISKKQIWAPDVETFVQPTKFLVLCNLNGVSPNDIRVDLEESDDGKVFLVLQGVKRPSQKEIMLFRMGYRSKIQPEIPFERKVALPSSEQIYYGSMKVAINDDGILQIYFDRVPIRHNVSRSKCKEGIRRGIPTDYFAPTPRYSRRTDYSPFFPSMFSY